jgi:hypothetical protein
MIINYDRQTFIVQATGAKLPNVLPTNFANGNTD